MQDRSAIKEKMPNKRFPNRKRLGKYRITRKIAHGGFATVYRALDTIEGIPVALKIPHPHLLDDDTLAIFRREVRLASRLDHPNILGIKTAGFIDDLFTIVYPLGLGTLHDRMTKRISDKTALSFTEQILQALAHAHERKIAHCDVKPENFILFPDSVIRLTDFGIARVMVRTLTGSGSGTVGYLAPEQALGKPSLRSDVFAAALIIYRLFSGRLPSWPFTWPFPGHDRLVRQVSPDMVALLRKALEVSEKKRFASTAPMLRAFLRLKSRAIEPAARRRARRRKRTRELENDRKPVWQEVRQRELKRKYGKLLELRHSCNRCHGPLSEAMICCPFCATSRKIHRDTSSLPARCTRCKRGLKLDWTYCPWCYGSGVGPKGTGSYTDVRYSARCSNASCKDRRLMPFMRYCPWCKRKVTRSWKIDGSGQPCHRCGWEVLRAYWDHCPWCAARLGRT
jgi:serine/threonine-protein kinase